MLSEMTQAVMKHGDHILLQRLFTIFRYNLGKILHSKGDYSKASECFVTAIELEETAPLISYSKIRKNLSWNF